MADHVNADHVDVDHVDADHVNAGHVTVAELESARAAGAVVVDVREPAEFAAGRVPGAVNVPFATVPLALGRLAELAGDGPLFVVCHVGGRSARAADYLTQYGIDSRTVDGGTQEWAAGGRPLDHG